MLNTKNKYFKISIFILLFILGVVLIILPKDYFDTGQSVCLSKYFFDVKCYGCGMTRGIQHLIHLDFQSAYNYNKLSFIVLPLFIILVLIEFKKTVKEFRGK